MSPSTSQLRQRALGIAALFLIAAPRAHPSPVPLESVAATFHDGSETQLLEVIDGSDVGRGGWSVAAHVAEPQAAIFRTRSPVEVETCEVTLCFLSGRPASYFDEFTLSATTDPNPSLESAWTPLNPVRFSATGPELDLGDDGRFTANGPKSEFRITGVGSDAVFQIGVRMPTGPVTAFRVDVFPRERPASKIGPTVAPSRSGDFMLTEFRVEAAESRTTNIALGKLVKASHPLWGPFTAGMLTDGLPGTIAHPIQPDLGGEFYFEIDLGTVRTLDHIALRNRGDGTVPERLSRVLLNLYEDVPDFGAPPVWRGRHRMDGSHPQSGELDIVHASAGTGNFRGRFLRISSESPIAFSPQLAEVEIYETLAVQLASVRIDDRPPATPQTLAIPAGARWIELALKFTHAGIPEDLPLRWRLRGYHADWQSAEALAVGLPCPPPGRYVFEAQARQTDREWDSAVFSLPMKVTAHFWQTAVFRALVLAAALAGLAWLLRNFTRRRLAMRMALLEAEAALDEVVWTVNPRHDTLASLAEYLAQCATSYLGPLEITCHVDAPLDWPPLEIRAQARHNLVLALKEALQNVVKHARATEVTLTLRHEPPHLLIRLTDDGTGLPDDSGGAGKDGLTNMRTRLESIGGTCSVRRREKGGTEVEMRAPLPTTRRSPAP